jgi:S1-C subfamily serine protease
VGGPSRGYVTRGAELAIGPVKIPGVVTSLSTQKKGSFADASYQGNIGGGTLKRFVVTFDYAHQTMYLKALPQPVADVGTFDRSGMWINATEDGFLVNSVSMGGPAEKGGLRKDDVITAIDGKKVAPEALATARALLRTRPVGSMVTLDYKRGGKPMHTMITLRDQI